MHLYYGDLLWDCSTANFVNFDKVICRRHDNGRVLSFKLFGTFILVFPLYGNVVLFSEKFVCFNIISFPKSKNTQNGPTIFTFHD